eukprot:scaffold40779_cov57-Attheya_sp.AAC.2
MGKKVHYSTSVDRSPSAMADDSFFADSRAFLRSSVHKNAPIIGGIIPMSSYPPDAGNDRHPLIELTVAKQLVLGQPQSKSKPTG